LQDIGFFEIWIQRLVVKIEKDSEYKNIEFNEKICKIISKEEEVLWDIDWLQSKHKELFYSKKGSIISDYEFKKQQTISIDRTDSYI